MEDDDNDMEVLLLALFSVLLIMYKQSLDPIKEYSKPGVGRSLIMDLLWCGHPERVRFALRMDTDVYCLLRRTLMDHIQVGRSLSLDEKMAMGLDWLGQGVTVRNQAEKFRRSVGTISAVCEEFVMAIIKSFGHTMTRDGWCFAGMNNMSIPRNDDFFYHFRGAVGSIDGSHFRLMVPEVDADRY